MKKKPTFIWMVSVFCCMTAAFVLAACQPTPNEPVVIEKKRRKHDTTGATDKATNYN